MRSKLTVLAVEWLEFIDISFTIRVFRMISSPDSLKQMMLSPKLPSEGWIGNKNKNMKDAK